VAIEAVDRREQAERLAQRQVPPQLSPLTEDDPNAGGQLAALSHRLQAARPHPSPGRHQDAGQHLDRGGLAGTVGADVANRLTSLHGERHRIDRGQGGPLAHQPPRALAAQRELSREVANLDDGAVRDGGATGGFSVLRRFGHPPPPW